MPDVIPDPDFEGFDGKFLDDSACNLPPNRHDLSAIAEYLRKTGKKGTELTKEELDMFLL